MRCEHCRFAGLWKHLSASGQGHSSSTVSPPEPSPCAWGGCCSAEPALPRRMGQVLAVTHFSPLQRAAGTPASTFPLLHFTAGGSWTKITRGLGAGCCTGKPQSRVSLTHTAHFKTNLTTFALLSPSVQPILCPHPPSHCSGWRGQPCQDSRPFAKATCP